VDAVKTVLAFDPGLKGAMAWVNEAGNIGQIEDMPVLAGEVNGPLIASLIAAYGEIECAIIEKQQAYPKQGVSSSFKTGTGYGILIGVCAGMHIPVVFWPASMWKKALRLNSDKEYSRKRALERWPFDVEYFKLKKHEGRAEAALMGASWWLSPERKMLLPEIDGVEKRPNSRRRLRRL
jgi:hypothetical protein